MISFVCICGSLLPSGKHLSQPDQKQILVSHNHAPFVVVIICTKLSPLLLHSMIANFKVTLVALIVEY